jgi:calcineurin-like phosphoesterase family protein
LDHCPQRGGSNIDEHDDWAIAQCLKVKSNKHTLWWFLGDVAFDEKKLRMLQALPGRKRLVLGNHDLFPTETYLQHFESIHCGIKKYRMWLTHIPIHPAELRGLCNVHGHCHAEQINDPRYLNVALEHLPGMVPISLEEVREGIQLRCL